MEQISNTYSQETLLTTKEAAKIFSLSPRFFEKIRSKGDGPKYLKLSSRSVRYRMSDLESWFEERLISCTLQSGGNK